MTESSKELQKEGATKPLAHLRTIGVYVIVCTANGKVYIGCSENVSERTTAHLAQLRSGKHFCKTLQADFKKYGPAAFEFSLIETHARRSEAAAAEKRLLIAHQKQGVYNTNTYLCITPRCRPAGRIKVRLASEYSYLPIIEKWPSLTALAADLEVTAECVRVMKMRDSIPARYWIQLVAGASSRGIDGVTLEALATIEAGKNGFLPEEVAA